MSESIVENITKDFDKLREALGIEEPVTTIAKHQVYEILKNNLG
jgi:hypothetical protein